MRGRVRSIGLRAAAVLAIGGLVAACGLGETAAGDVATGAAVGDATRITMLDDTFQPAVVQVPAGQRVVFELSNEGQASHNFTNEALNVSTGPMQAGEVKTLRVAIPAGTTQFVCTWHDGMTIDVIAQ